MQWCAMDYNKRSLFYTNHSYALNNSPSWKVDTELTFISFGNDSPLGGYVLWWEDNWNSSVIKMRVNMNTLVE